MSEAEQSRTARDGRRPWRRAFVPSHRARPVAVAAVTGPRVAGAAPTPLPSPVVAPLAAAETTPVDVPAFPAVPVVDAETAAGAPEEAAAEPLLDAATGPSAGAVPACGQGRIRDLTLVAVAVVAAATVAVLLPSAGRPAVFVGIVGVSLLLALAVVRTRHLSRLVEETHGEQGRLLSELRRLDDVMRGERTRLHEINAIAAGLAAAARLLDDDRGLGRERVDRLHRMMHAEADRLHRLVDPGRRPELMPVHVAAVAWPVVARLAAAGHPVSLLCDETTTVLADPDVVAEVLSILLENAHQHAPGSPVRVQVSTGRDGRVEIAVQDEGPGVDPAVAPRLFGWRVRGASSTGQGIGLYSARELVRRQGGDLRVETGTGGSSFVLSLRDAARKEASRGDTRRPGHVA
ncbi:ATP-binding protein [Nocardioides sp. GY 10127]|uniref:sensor histidine kinase n=1 Tax=Nocardioides sp. GY 10127 TaxID=2569762 RepID=UPI0010A811C9|nr:ATP-binding protein [Nocardioides sp. GY 10127]TIC81850.1 sensor histidine kinase [Nocardioides sp. GY 10127]